MIFKGSVVKYQANKTIGKKYSTRECNPMMSVLMKCSFYAICVSGLKEN